jgi:sporulation protein YqfC
MARKRDLRSKVASLFELPGEVLLDVARVSLVGDTELLLENHKGIMEYQNDRLVLRVPHGSAVITGNDLAIVTISPEQILVRGKIRSFQYQE